MDRSLWTDEVEETIRFIFFTHLQEVFDDPYDVDAEEVGKLERAGKFLGVHIWDRDQMASIYQAPTQIEWDRLRAIRDGVR